MNFLRVSLCFVVAVMMLPGCGQKGRRFRAGTVDRVPRIETIEPTLNTVLPLQIELSATVMAMETTILSARVPGVIGTLAEDIDIGRPVKAGEVLVQLAIPDLEADKKAKEALLEQAKKAKLLSQASEVVAARELEESRKQEARYQADYAYRKLEYDRVSQLASTQAVTVQRAEEAKNQLDSAGSAWEAAKAQVQTKLAKIQAASADLEVAESKIKVAEADFHRLVVLVSYATITAPYDGVITKRWVDRGAMVKDAGASLLTVMRTDQVRVVMDVPEADVPMINATEQRPNSDGKGDPIQLEIPALRNLAGSGFNGNITRISESLDPATRTMRAEAILDNKDRLLRPGMYGTATILLEQRENVLTVPSTALLRRGNQVEIYYVEESKSDPSRGIVRRAQVELGSDDGRRVQVRGLTGKEKIIAKGNGMVREGDEVIPVPLR